MNFSKLTAKSLIGTATLALLLAPRPARAQVDPNIPSTRHFLRNGSAFSSLDSAKRTLHFIERYNPYSLLPAMWKKDYPPSGGIRNKMALLGRLNEIELIPKGKLPRRAQPAAHIPSAYVEWNGNIVGFVRAGADKVFISEVLVTDEGQPWGGLDPAAGAFLNRCAWVITDQLEGYYGNMFRHSTLFVPPGPISAAVFTDDPCKDQFIRENGSSGCQ